MICEKCKNIINVKSRTPKEAMKRYIAKLRKDNKKFKEKNGNKKL